MANATQLVGAANGASPGITAIGDTDANVNLVLTTKGTGAVQVPTGGVALQGGGHLTSAGTAPTVAIGTAAGAGSASITAGSTDQRGQISVTVSTGLTTGILATVSLQAALPAAPFVVFSPANAAAAGLSTTEPFAQGDSTTTWTLRANGAALANGTYLWNYCVWG